MLPRLTGWQRHVGCNIRRESAGGSAGGILRQCKSHLIDSAPQVGDQPCLVRPPIRDQYEWHSSSKGKNIYIDADIIQLLSDLRYSIEPEPRCLLGIEPLDRLLDIFRYPHGSNTSGPTTTRPADQDDPAESLTTTTQTSLNVRSTKPTPGLIELNHSISTADTTDLLYYIAAISILPKSHGGKESTIVWLDSDTTFSATRLHQICTHHLSHTSNPSSTIESALQHVHIFNISSTTQLLSTLDTLPTYLLHSHDHHSHHRSLSLIILTSATTFHWTDRFDADLARLDSSSTAAPPKPTTQILTRLKALQSTFDNVCIYTTKHELTTIASVRAETTPSFSPWTLNATLVLTTARVAVPQFASDMSLEACVRDRAKRQEVVGRGRVRVGVDEEWLANVVKVREARRAVRRLEGRGAFVVRITGEGVIVE